MNQISISLVAMYVAVAAFILTASCASAQSAGMRGDTNGDGIFSRAEMEASVDARFARVDANGDGALDTAEQAQMREQNQGRRGRGRRANRPGMDANGDGRITREEFGAPTRDMFRRADANSDGMISSEERQALRQAIRNSRN